MDLDQYKKRAEDGATMTLLQPTGEPFVYEGKPVTITVAGLESDRYKAARNELTNERLKRATPRDVNALSIKTAEEYVENDAITLAKITLAWEGIFFNGALQECNFENAKKLYVGWDLVRNQVNAFIGENKNFWTASSKN